jgi:hypothetical protein
MLATYVYLDPGLRISGAILHYAFMTYRGKSVFTCVKEITARMWTELMWFRAEFHGGLLQTGQGARHVRLFSNDTVYLTSRSLNIKELLSSETSGTANTENAASQDRNAQPYHCENFKTRKVPSARVATTRLAQLARKKEHSCSCHAYEPDRVAWR